MKESKCLKMSKTIKIITSILLLLNIIDIGITNVPFISILNIALICLLYTVSNEHHKL